MAIKSRQKGRPQARSSFQRRLTWREVEAAFDHLFDVSLDDGEAGHIVRRFRRARTQLLPLFSQMVVSTYERERIVAFRVLEGMGGQATCKMLDELLADEDVQTALKPDLGALRRRLGPLAEDDEDEEGEDEFEPRPDRGEDEAEVEADEAEIAGDEPEPRERRGRSRRDRSERRRPEPVDEEPRDEAEPSTGTDDETAAQPRRRRRRRGRRTEGEATSERPTLDPALFDGPAEPLLVAFDDSPEAVLDTFAQLPLPKRLSFIDRSGRLADRRALKFLLPLLETTEWAAVQSALRAIGELGFQEALPAVEALAADTSRKRVQLRAARVRDELLSAGQPAEPAPQPDSDASAEAPAPRPAPRSRDQRERPDGPRPRPRSPEPAGPTAAEVLGLLPDEPAEAPVPELELSRAERLPRLVAALAGPLEVDGRQRLLAYRGDASHGVERLELVVHDRLGWLALSFATGLPADQPERDRAADETLIEVTLGYLKARAQETRLAAQTAGRPLPEAVEAVLGYVGGGRRVEPAADLPEATEPPTQEALEAALNTPLCRSWRLPLDPAGEAVARWRQTSGKRSASRLRRKLIDEVVQAWLGAGRLPALIDRLRRQAVLLERSGAADAAGTLLTAAATLTVATGDALDHRLLRELAYRGFQAALDQVRRERQGESEPETTVGETDGEPAEVEVENEHTAE